MKSLAGPKLNSPEGQEDLLLESDGVATQHTDKVFIWNAPLAARGLLNSFIVNAIARDPYGIYGRFLFMANMSWNSSMTMGVVATRPKAKDANGSCVVPKTICSDAHSTEMAADADIILLDTIYLECYDCISLLDRQLSEPHIFSDDRRWLATTPDHDVCGVQFALLDLGARLGVPGKVNDGGFQKYRDDANYIIRRERQPAIGPCVGRRGQDGGSAGHGAPNVEQQTTYFRHCRCVETERFQGANVCKHANRAWQESAVKLSVQDAPTQNHNSVWTWNAIGKCVGAWNLALDASEARKSFLLNHLIHELRPSRGDCLRWSNTDPITGQAAWVELRRNIEKAQSQSEEISGPLRTLRANPLETPANVPRYGQEWTT